MKSIKIVSIIIVIIFIFSLILFFTKSEKRINPDILCKESYTGDCTAYIIEECENLEGQTIYSV